MDIGSKSSSYFANEHGRFERTASGKRYLFLEDVAYALIETDGKLSVVKKPDKNTVTAGMLAIAVPDTGIEAVVISDGVISPFSLKLIRKSQAWLEGVLRGKNITQDKIFLMTADTSGSFNIIRKEGK